MALNKYAPRGISLRIGEFRNRCAISARYRGLIVTSRLVVSRVTNAIINNSKLAIVVSPSAINWRFQQLNEQRE